MYIIFLMLTLWNEDEWDCFPAQINRFEAIDVLRVLIVLFSWQEIMVLIVIDIDLDAFSIFLFFSGDLKH